MILDVSISYHRTLQQFFLFNFLLNVNYWPYNLKDTYKL